MKKFHLASALMLFASCLGLYAQTETKYERGATYLENTVPPSPEPASIVKYADVPFTHSTGMAEYVIPFYTLQGRELNIPIGLHYASGGIKLDEIAGVAGLGWTLEAGGCITRTVMDMPDEYVPNIGSFHHEMPSGTLLSNLENMVENDATLNFLRDVVWNRVDVSLDRYSYSVCGLSGSFVIQDNGNVFQLSGDGVLIDYTRDADGSIDMFTITGPDGTVYTFSVKEQASRDGRGIEPIGPMNGKLDEWTAPTAWHLTTMRSRSGLETAEFAYSDVKSWNRSVRSRSETLTMTLGGEYTAPSRSISSKTVESIYDARVLTSIILNGTAVTFTYSDATGNVSHKDVSIPQQNFPFRLTGIEVNVSGNEKPLCRMDVKTAGAPYDGRIILNSLELYREDTLDNRWDFTYKGVGRTVSAGSQDWYGYYNGENEFSEDGRTILCPYEVNVSNGGSFNLTTGFPNAEYASYMSLISVDNDKAVTNFTYEGNSYDAARNISIGVRVKKITLPGNLFKPTRVRYFSYESPYAGGPTEPSEHMYCTSSMSILPLNPSASYEWQYTLHETPVTLGPSIRDSRIYYGRVREDVCDQGLPPINATAPVANSVRTVYEYSMDGVRTHNQDCISRLPSACKELYDGNNSPLYAKSRLGLRQGYNNYGPSVAPTLRRKEDYAYSDGEYKMVSSIDYEYNMLKRNSVLVDYHATQAYQDQLGGHVTHGNVYHFPIYAWGNYGKRPIKEILVNHHASGNDTTVVTTSYVKRERMSDPTRVSAVSMNDGDKTRNLSYVYADKWPLMVSWTSALTSQHCLSVPVWRGMTYSRDSILTVSPDLSPASIGDVLVPQPFPTPSTPSPLSPSADKEELTKYDWFTIGGQQYLLPSSHTEKMLGVESWREDVLSRDQMGNITSFKEKGHPETVVLWGYNALLPVAVIKNATYAQVVNEIGGEAIINGIASAEKPSQADLAKLNRLRESPLDAHVTTYTHQPGIGVISVTDPAGLMTTFEYEGGRLVCTRDNDGHKINEYEYHLLTDADGRKHIRSRTFRSADAQSFTEDVIWWDKYGRKTQDIAVKASLNNADLVTAYESDFMFHDDVKTWLPYPKHNTNGQFQAEATGEAAEYHANEKAYSSKNYEMSARDRVVSEALPGYAGEHETSYTTDIADELIHYRWENDAVCCLDPYAPDEIVVSKVTDADGRLTSTYTDHSGKTLATSNGEDAPTYYIYDLYERLRAVVSSGIAITDTLNMWRYDYDSLGRMSSKGIPGSVREYYTYDEEDRIIAILRDGVLKEMEYDTFGRVLKVWQTRPGSQRTLLEQHTYDAYPVGVTGSNPKGKKTQSLLAVIMPDGNVSGHTRVTWSYDDKGRPVVVRTSHADGSEQIEELEYTFAGDLASSVSTYIHGDQCDEFVVDYTYDIRGRLTKESATLTVNDHAPQVAEVTYGYDALGRCNRKGTSVPEGKTVHAISQYALQGWQTDHKLILNGRLLFEQTLGYDEESTLYNYVPQYGGMVSLKEEKWHQASGDPVSSQEWYQYDYAGRLGLELRPLSRTAYTYDARGNVQSVGELHSGQMVRYSYNGDRLDSLRVTKGLKVSLPRFTYDNLGRMTYDGLTGQSMTYNDLDLLGKVEKDSSTLANYSYLSDGTKLSATDGSGKGLEYRGPFVYRKSSDDSSLTLESAAFSGGRMTPDGVLLHMTDYLGSIRAVVDGQTGELYKASDYSAFGSESEVETMQTAITPLGITLRDGYTGKENQNLDFSTNYTDFGARQYNPALRRWMTPDPLSEKYYGISPYAFCNNNPVNFVDPDGEAIDILWDIASIGMGVSSFVQNVKSGNISGAIGDGVGVLLDVAAAAVPFIPGGVGALRAGGKVVDAATDVLSLAKSVERVDDAIDNTKATSKLQEAAEIGKEAHRQIQGELVEAIPGTQTEVTIRLDEKTVRKDAVKPDGTVVIIKPDTPSGHKSAAQREQLMKNNGYETETIFYDPTNSRWLPDSPTYIGPKR